MLTTSVERLEGVTVRLTVTVAADEVDAAIERAYKSAAAKVKIPGFRPGKAPKPMLESMLGREYLMAEATEDVVNTTYPQALDKEGLRPIEAPELEDLETVEPSTEFTYSADIDVRPELTLTGTDEFEVTLPGKEASDAEIDAQIELARDRFASLEPVEDRGAQENDFALLSFVGTVEGEGYEGNEVDKYLYELGRGLMPPEFDAGIIGLTGGDTTRVEFVIPDTTSNPEFAGKNAAFDITVHEVKAKVLPELNEEFAAQVGGFDSYEDLRADLRTRITTQKTVNYERLREQRSREAVAARLEGEVPEAMIVARQSSMTRDFITMLEGQELMIDQYLAQAGVDMETFEADMRVQALQTVREDLALEALFRALDMELTDADVDEELKEVAQATNSTPDEARARWADMGLMAVLHEQIMHRKAVMWLLDNVAVIEAPDEPDAETEE
ncbi:MAG: trigger factor [Coriobacteriia bacterium]|nr:trigger factor [Coriobacteriia bacterium]